MKNWLVFLGKLVLAFVSVAGATYLTNPNVGAAILAGIGADATYLAKSPLHSLWAGKSNA